MAVFPKLIVAIAKKILGLKSKKRTRVRKRSVRASRQISSKKSQRKSSRSSKKTTRLGKKKIPHQRKLKRKVAKVSSHSKVSVTLKKKPPRKSSPRSIQKKLRLRRKRVDNKSLTKKGLIQKRRSRVRPVVRSRREQEILIGEVTHYFSKIKVGVIKITNGFLKTKEQIHIKGFTSDFRQTVESMQIESVDVAVAKRGQIIGLKVIRKIRPSDKIYKVLP